MKTRKLFAILTLVAFMMTLLPVAAFAADNYNTASKSASKISIESKSKAAGNEVEVTVALRGANNKPADTLVEKVYGGKEIKYALFVWPERAKDSLSDVDKVASVVDKNGNFVEYKIEGAAQDSVVNGNYLMVTDEKLNSKTGTIKVKFTSSIADEVTFKAALAPVAGVTKPVSNIDDVVGEDKYLIGSQSFEWKQRGVDKIRLTKVTDSDDKDIDIVGDEDEYTVKGLYADGEEYELTFVVEDKDGNPLAGEKVEFTLNKTGANLNKTEATTDVLGEVEVKVYAYKADDYRLSVKKGSKITVVKLDFEGDYEPFNIELSDEITDKVALESSPTIEFKLYDVFGNRILKNGLEEFLKDPDFDQDDDVVFSKKPSASDLEDEDISVEPDGDVLKVRFDQEPDVAGTYEIKVKLPNGKYATCTFEAAEQGEITSMVLDIKESYLAYGSTTGKIKVKYYDNNRVFYEDEDLTTVELSVSDSSLAKVTADNRIQAREAKYNDYSSGKVVVTAIDTARGLVATDEIIVGSLIAGLDVAAPDEAVLVGETATITYQLVNQNGDPIAFDADQKKQIEVDAYVISKPDGAQVSIDLPLESDYQKTLSRTGKIDVKVTSDVPGTLGIALVVEGPLEKRVEEVYEKDNDGKYQAVIKEVKEDVTLSANAEIKFVAEKVALGAKSVTLFIGSTNYVVDGQPKVSDLAPFIQDNRTFVPVRLVAEALGAEVEYDAATQTVTIAREDLTATLTIGSNEITLSDGTVVVSDVAPFIKDGRTVLPFRVIGEDIFGADVEAVPAADGRTIAVQFQQ